MHHPAFTQCPVKCRAGLLAPTIHFRTGIDQYIDGHAQRPQSPTQAHHFVRPVSTVGSITKKSILLVDACHKRSRPILMTTVAMDAGMMALRCAAAHATSSCRHRMLPSVSSNQAAFSAPSTQTWPIVFRSG